LIIVDSSAIISVLARESDAVGFEESLAAEPDLAISAANKLEVMMVYGGKYGQAGLEAAQELFDRYSIVVTPVTEALADHAAKAFLKYGKGRHKAALNFGDCMAYALAKSLDAPLLFKGNDFSLTDVRPALA
jgi:ribonuclease VapC